MMLNLIDELPLMLVGTQVLAWLNILDLVKLECACGSKKTRQLFLDLVTLCPPVELPSRKHQDLLCLEWFMKRSCKIKLLIISLPKNSAVIHVNNLKVDKAELHFESNVTMEDCKPLFENNLTCRINCIVFDGDQNKDVIEKLSVCVSNVEKIAFMESPNNTNWMTGDMLSRWKLKDVTLRGSALNLILLIIQTCTELTSIKLDSSTVNDDVVMALVQHCPKLETLVINSGNITYTSLIALSERGLPLKELDIPYIPNIPTADIARRCSHALSCVRHLDTDKLYENDQDANILIPYLTGLTSVDLDYYVNVYIPLLTRHCHKLTKIEVFNVHCIFTDILSLCRANPLLQVFYCYYKVGITDPLLIELIHACPHLHTLFLPYETDITDTGILALSEHCSQLQCLDIKIYAHVEK